MMRAAILLLAVAGAVGQATARTASADLITEWESSVPAGVCPDGVEACYGLKPGRCAKAAARLFEVGFERTDPPKALVALESDRTPPALGSAKALKKLMPGTLVAAEVKLWTALVTAYWQRAVVRYLDSRHKRKGVELDPPCRKRRRDWGRDPGPKLMAFRILTKRDLKKACGVATALGRKARFHKMPFDWRSRQFFQLSLNKARSPETHLAFQRIRENSGFEAASALRAYAADVTGKEWSCRPLDKVLKGPEFAPGDEYSQPKPKAQLPDPGLSAATFKAVMDAAQSDFLGCYAKRLRQKPSLVGRIFVMVSINPNGSVQKVQARKRGTTLIDAPLFACLRARILSIRFPPTGISRPQTLIYPFDFDVKR